MEIEIPQSSLSPRRETTRVSSFDSEPREFKRWLAESNGDRLMRLDQPNVLETASETAKVPKSIYGVCQPIKPVFVPLEKDRPFEKDSPSLDQTERELRLIRLLEKQQEWYDAREQARVRAESYLDIIDQHQKQWLNQQPSTPREYS